MTISKTQIVIVGGGIMGVCTAYYLTREEAYRNGELDVTLVEEGEIAGGASGKAAGFIARDWHGAPTRSLGELSWHLHDQLATELGGEKAYGYRRVKSYSLDAKPASQRRHVGSSKPVVREADPSEMQAPTRALPHPQDWLSLPSGTEAAERTLGWLDSHNVTDLRELGDEETTAQVTPQLFVHRLWKECLDAGVKHVRGKAVGSKRTADGGIAALSVETEAGETTYLATDKLLLAAGPWTGKVAQSVLGVRVPIRELPGHSIIYRPTEPLPAEAIFAAVRDHGVTNGPEIFTRPDGTLYIAGENSGAPLPPGTSAMSLSEPSVDRLKKCMAILSPAIAEGEIVSINLCYRPITSSGYPFVSALSGVLNAWVCAGHGPWGITLAPGSGKVVSEMILGKTTRSADVSLLGLPTSS